VDFVEEYIGMRNVKIKLMRNSIINLMNKGKIHSKE
jgi:hypothetical protein